MSGGRDPQALRVYRRRSFQRLRKDPRRAAAYQERTTDKVRAWRADHPHYSPARAAALLDLSIAAVESLVLAGTLRRRRSARGAGAWRVDGAGVRLAALHGLGLAATRDPGHAALERARRAAYMRAYRAKG